MIPNRSELFHPKMAVVFAGISLQIPLTFFSELLSEPGMCHYNILSIDLFMKGIARVRAQGGHECYLCCYCLLFFKHSRVGRRAYMKDFARGPRPA